MLKPTLLAVSLTFALAACNAPPAQPVPPTVPELATCPGVIAIRNFKFEPANCRVAPGTTLTFYNYDTVPHNAVAEEGAAAPFETPDLDEGESATVTFTAVGEYPYLCTFHPDMRGKITVQ